MHMFPYIEKSRSIRFLLGRQPFELSRLVLAVALSILAHAMVLLTANFKISSHGWAGGSATTYVIARLADHRNGKSPEGVEPAQVVSEEQVEATGPQFQNQSKDVPASVYPQKESFSLPGEDSGFGAEASSPAYFSSDLLTVRPYPITQLETPDLRKPLQKGNFGRVVLRVWISDTGVVSSTETEFSDMPTAECEAIVAAFQRMRFKPGELHGKPVGSIFRIEMTYEDLRLSVAD